MSKGDFESERATAPNTGESLAIGAVALAAAELGLFGALSARASTAAELEQRLGLDARALELVLNVLVAAGLAQSDGVIFSLAPKLTELERALPGGVEGWCTLLQSLPAFLRTGRPSARMDGTPSEREVAYRDAVSALAVFFGR